jgi:hypothetical protein
MILAGRTRATRQSQRGGGRLKAIFWLLILLYGIFVGYKIVPIYLANYELQDKMQTEARFSTVNKRSDEQLRDIIFREIQDREIPARREDIHIDNSPRGVKISVDYTVPIDLKLYTWNKHFTITAENKALY